MTDSRSSLELLFNISRELTSALDLRTVLTRMLHLSTQNVGAERGSVIVMDEHQHLVDAAIIYEGRLTPHTIDPLKSTLEQGLAGWVVTRREPALVTDTSQDKRWLRRPEYENDLSGAKSAICVPILAREELVGVLTLVHARPNSFGDEHLALLKSIADQAGIAIQNARLYASMQAAQKRYQDLFEDSIDPILITNLDGKIQETNRQAAILSARSHESLLNASVWSLHSIKPEWLEQNLEAVQAGETISTESEFQPLSGTAVPVEIYVHAFHFGGEELLQWIIRDISERKQLDRLRDDLSAMIYHDLRSPLANIVSSLDMLRVLISETPDENQDSIIPQVVSIAIRSTERMQRLINSLLDINRLEAGQPITSQKSVSIASLFAEAMDAMLPVIQTRRQQVTVNIEDGLPPMRAEADRGRSTRTGLWCHASTRTRVSPSS
jgi:PAS domain S-box-containing protein